MQIFSNHDQNWDNFLVLLTALALTVFVTFVNNRFSAQRFHNITKLGNEILSRCVQATIGFYPALGLLVEGNTLGKRVMIFVLFTSASAWFASLLATEHIAVQRIKKHHLCAPQDDDSPHICNRDLSFKEVFEISIWNILIFAAAFLLAAGISFTRMACGGKCIEPVITQRISNQ